MASVTVVPAQNLLADGGIVVDNPDAWWVLNHHEQICASVVRRDGTDFRWQLHGHTADVASEDPDVPAPSGMAFSLEDAVEQLVATSPLLGSPAFEEEQPGDRGR